MLCTFYQRDEHNFLSNYNRHSIIFNAKIRSRVVVIPVFQNRRCGVRIRVGRLMNLKKIVYNSMNKLNILDTTKGILLINTGLQRRTREHLAYISKFWMLPCLWNRRRWVRFRYDKENIFQICLHPFL